jgi:hypothetical protein
VFSQYQLSNHHQPEMERRFIRIKFSLIGKGEDVSITKRFINNAQITQLVIVCKVTQNHNGQQGNKPK